MSFTTLNKSIRCELKYNQFSINQIDNHKQITNFSTIPASLNGAVVLFVLESLSDDDELENLFKKLFGDDDNEERQAKVALS